jgi:hypothetical protein
LQELLEQHIISITKSNTYKLAHVWTESYGSSLWEHPISLLPH